MSEMTAEQALAEVARLKAQMEQERLESQRRQQELYKQLKGIESGTRKLSFKVSEKGAVTVVGLRRFGVTLYKNEWERIEAQFNELKAFIAANNHALSQGKNAGQIE